MLSLGQRNPMRQGGLIAPIRETRHDTAMPDCIQERIAASSRQTARVQKARSVSRTTGRARLPAAFLAWRAARKDWLRNSGKYRQDRTRSRVIDTKGVA